MEKKTGELLESLFSLEGKRGIVTGASSGIGLEIARVLAGAGAEVYDFSRTIRPEHACPGVTQVQADVTEYAVVEREIARIFDGGPMDFLVNNAGVTKRTRAEEVSPELWDYIHGINVDALFHLCQASYPYLKLAKDKGRIVNIASMASYMGFSEVVPYCSAKSAVRGITRGLAVEWIGDGILTNSISPGWFPSQMNRQVMDEDRKKKILGKIPMGCFGDGKDIGAMVLFLLGRGAGYINGQDFVVDGGAQTFGF